MRHYDFTISRRLLTFLAAGFLTISAQSAPAPTAGLTHAQKEEFLLKAKIVTAKPAAKGITTTLRATLSDGQLTHDASIQRIDDTKHNYETNMGTEMVFRDSWEFNVAAYKLDRLLGLNMIPATVERVYQGTHGSFTWRGDERQMVVRDSWEVNLSPSNLDRLLGMNMIPATVERVYQGTHGSFTWWVDDVLMDEGERQSKKQQSPDKQTSDDQMSIVNVFDQLIYNIDRNVGNLLYDKDWQIWMIDHTRAFRTNTDLMDAKVLTRCDSALLEKLKQLDAATLKKEIGAYDIDSNRIKGLLARRDKIVKIFEQKGPSAMFTSPRLPD